MYFNKLLLSLNTELELEIRTDSDNALLVWFGAETGDLNLVGGRRKEGKEKRMKGEHDKGQEQGAQDYLGLGIEDGLLKVSIVLLLLQCVLRNMIIEFPCRVF